MPDITERPYQSGGSAPTYAALDTARNELDKLAAVKAKAMDAIRSAVWDLMCEAGADDRCRLDVIDRMQEALDDLTWDRERDLKDEIDTLEVALED